MQLTRMAKSESRNDSTRHYHVSIFYDSEVVPKIKSFFTQFFNGHLKTESFIITSVSSGRIDFLYFPVLAH